MTRACFPPDWEASCSALESLLRVHDDDYDAFHFSSLCTLFEDRTLDWRIQCFLATSCYSYSKRWSNEEFSGYRGSMSPDSGNLNIRDSRRFTGWLRASVRGEGLGEMGHGRGFVLLHGFRVIDMIHLSKFHARPQDSSRRASFLARGNQVEIPSLDQVDHDPDWTRTIHQW